MEEPPQLLLGLDLGTSNGFLTKYRTNNTAELLEKGGQAEQEAKFRGNV